ncbi:MAG TPA: 16S rRNA (guanine(527)-N(7))-methyltransferase RsmG [Pirellulales bacterium]|nr:16S rRNA (guanine(527)-N(7))-methyltransferase RsmG [Pirellulales bacterium]
MVAPADVSQLVAVLESHAIALTDAQVAQLADYAHRLWDWNTKINLTRHTDYERFVTRDVVDTLELSKVLAPEERVLDVGTGGGVPGVLLAILRPDLHVRLAESMGKKARVVEDIVRGMQLEVPVHAGRAEELLADEYYDSLVMRAVAPLEKLLGWFEPHWGAFGRMLVIKGPAWVEERHAAREAGRMRGLQLRKLATWPLPGTESESVLLEVRPKDDAA